MLNFDVVGQITRRNRRPPYLKSKNKSNSLNGKTVRTSANVLAVNADRTLLVEMRRKAENGRDISATPELGRGKRTRIHSSRFDLNDDLTSEDDTSPSEEPTSKKKKANVAVNSAAILHKLKQKMTESGDKFSTDEERFEILDDQSQEDMTDMQLQNRSLKAENSKLRQCLQIIPLLPRATSVLQRLIQQGEKGLRNPTSCISTPPVDDPCAWSPRQPEVHRKVSSPFGTPTASMPRTPLVVSPSTSSIDTASTSPSGGEVISKKVLDRCNKSGGPQKFVNDILTALYSRDFLETHTVTQMETAQVEAIYDVCRMYFPYDVRKVSDCNRLIRQKLNNYRRPNMKPS